VWGIVLVPEENLKAYEDAWKVFAERAPILDVFKQEGSSSPWRYPTEIAYNIETAGDCLKAIDNRWSSVSTTTEPFRVQMIDRSSLSEVWDRLYHAHAKDSELQEDEIARSGVIPNGRGHGLTAAFAFGAWLGQHELERIMTACCRSVMIMCCPTSMRTRSCRGRMAVRRISSS